MVSVSRYHPLANEIQLGDLRKFLTFSVFSSKMVIIKLPYLFCRCFDIFNLKVGKYESILHKVYVSYTQGMGN